MKQGYSAKKMEHYGLCKVRTVKNDNKHIPRLPRKRSSRGIIIL